jgi:hypothetical protein
MVALYSLVVLLFTWLYLLVDGERSQCGLAPTDTTLDFHTAFAFSVDDHGSHPHRDLTLTTTAHTPMGTPPSRPRLTPP